MAMNEPFDWRRSERRLFAVIALLFPVIILIGFGRTYYLKFAFDTPPLASLLVHLHGLLMTLWVGFFIGQVWLIRSRDVKTHMKMGWLGVGLAILILVVGFFTMAHMAKYGAPSAPPDIPSLNFSFIPFMDLVIFAILFGTAIWYRTRPADHKRLMLLTVLNFLPPALARIQVPSFQALGPLFFFGVPTLLAIGLLVYDTWRNKKLNKVFLIGSVILIGAFVLRLALMGTVAWVNFATWLTTWAA